MLFLPLTGLISIGSICAAPLARRIGRPAVLGIGQAVLATTFLAVAWASTSSALWLLVLALVPAGFSSGLLVTTMTSQSIAAVEPALHGAASAVFNTSRQIGAAIGVAATALALLLTALTRLATVAAPRGSLNAQATCATSAHDNPDNLAERA